MATTLSSLRSLGPVALLRLAGWKARQRVQHVVNGAGGAARLERWRQRRTAFWLARLEAGEAPGGGRWLVEDDARTWAAAGFSAGDQALAEAAAAWRIPLLGAHTDPAQGQSWRRDLYSGVEWPLEPSGRLRIVRGDGSDIRTVWELSRCYHFLPLARAWAATGEARWAESVVAHATSFRKDNPPGFGPHWASPMDVAIRAANWSVALQVLGDAVPAADRAAMLADLETAGRWVAAHLEWHPVYRGNHYVANLVGLAYVGSLFRGTRDGDRWLRLASRELQREIRYQVCADGVAFEASLAYHRLHTELFAWAGELLRRHGPEFDEAAYDAVLGRMTRFIACYTQPDGNAPMMGDADDGRLHALPGGALLSPRQHGLGLPERWPVPMVGDGAFPFPAGGFHVLRHGRHHAVMRCGPVGLKGAGSHDHNDQLSLELVVNGHRLVSDSGTYAYTRDLRARHEFRSTASHSVVQVGGEEQNPIAVERPWRVLADRTQSRLLQCEAAGGLLVLEGEHRGFAQRPSGAVCVRRVTLATATGEWLVEDEVRGAAEEEVAWRLGLEADHVAVQGDGAEVQVTCTAGRRRFGLWLDVPAGMKVTVAEGRASDAYGTCRTRPVLLALGVVRLPARIRCRIHELEPQEQ